jgi:hypothetical protein
MSKATGNENASGILEKHWRTGFRFVPVKKNLSTKQAQWCRVLNIFAKIHKEPSVLPIYTLWEVFSKK